MKRQIALYIDAPQHFRIASALISALDGAAEVSLLAPIAVPPDLAERAGTRVHALAAPALPAWLRGGLRVLLRGLLINRQLRRFMRARAGQQTLVVFNDTGIAQRYLLRTGNRLGWKTVLVQDGLTETQHRETTPQFLFKRRLTARVLAPLGLAHYGTSRYGCAGAAVVLADGPLSVAFFRERAPGASVVQAGFLRPGLEPGSAAGETYVLFWAVDFLGGLHNRALHDLQLQVIGELAGALAAAGAGLVLRVRLHPGDAQYADEYAARLAGLPMVEIAPASEQPFAGGPPLAALSLQSAGVFDALAASVPAFFLEGQWAALAPQWAPRPLRIGHDGCAGLLARMAREPGLAAATWQAQVRSLESRVRIPFDPAAVKAALG